MKTKKQARFLFFLVYLMAIPSYAEIIIDGSLNQGSFALVAPNYMIRESFGIRQGSNLYHSFSKFNIQSGEQANFQAQNGIKHIIGRVTGGEVSFIEGTITSPTNLWLMNPAGWVFGENASLNVQGAFHLSTAEAINFTNGGVFFADSSHQSKLSTASPLGYQFFQPSQAKITMNGTVLKSADNNALSLVAANISLNNTSIKIAGGQISMATATQASNWQVNSSGLSSSTPISGEINISHDESPTLNHASIDISGFDVGGGEIQLSSGKMNFNNGLVLATVDAEDKGGDINLSSSESIKLNNTAIRTDTFFLGDSGNITIDTPSLIMNQGSRIRADGQNGSEGQVGSIEINSQQLSLDNESIIAGFVQGSGEGGNIQLNTKQLSLKNNSAIRVVTFTEANAGNISIKSDRVNLNNGGTIDASTFSGSQGDGGTIMIKTHQLTMSSQGTLLTSSNFGQGLGGDIQVDAQQLSLVNQAEIRVDSHGGNQAGNIQLNASEIFSVDNAKINSEAQSADGGTLSMTAGILSLKNAQITTSVEGKQGNGGNINVEAKTLIMNTGFIQANTTGENAKGGDIQINSAQFIASQDNVLVGGDTRQNFQKNSGINVIQAAAPNGVSGRVSVQAVELNISADLMAMDSRFNQPVNMGKNPCRVARGQDPSSLIEVGQDTLATTAADGFMMPITEISNNSNAINNESNHSGPPCQQNDN